MCGLKFLDFVIPNVFSSISQHVFKGFNIFLNIFPIAPHIVPYVLPNIVLLEPI
jgi:hypothetical protein